VRLYKRKALLLTVTQNAKQRLLGKLR